MRLPAITRKYIVNAFISDRLSPKTHSVLMVAEIIKSLAQETAY